jgi:hypothetical protein
MTEQQILRKILQRLTSIEEKLEYQSNPARSFAVSEKAAIMRKALATGDKKKIRAASKIINGE